MEYLEVGTVVKRPTDREILDFFYLGLITKFTLFRMTTWWFGSPFLVHEKKLKGSKGGIHPFEPFSTLIDKVTTTGMSR